MTTSKLTRDRHRKIVDMVRLGNFRIHAAAAAGISERTMKNWMARGTKENAAEPYREFAEDVLKAENAAICTAVMNIQEAAQDDWRASAWFASKKAPEQWGDKQVLELKIRDALQEFLNDAEALMSEGAFDELIEAVDRIYGSHVGPVDAQKEEPPA